MTNKIFPNGFGYWQETHFEIVSHIVTTCKTVGTMANDVNNLYGTKGMYKLAEELTDEFENLHKGRTWDGDYFDEIEKFLLSKEL